MGSNSTFSARHISMVAYDNAGLLDVTGPLDVFHYANEVISKELVTSAKAYETQILAKEKGPVTMSSGITLVANNSYLSPQPPTDTLILAGGNGAEKVSHDPGLITFVRQMTPRVRRMASICTGSFILARAGLLDRKKATTHWSASERFKTDFSTIAVQPDKIFTKDGHVYTSAGVTAGIDLALHLVEEDFGRKAALAVARILVVFMKRKGGQSQFSSHLTAQTNMAGPLGKLLRWIIHHPREQLTVRALAAKAAMGERNFSRVFVKETGVTPAKFVEQVRINKAASYLENMTIPMEQVADLSGFGSAEKMRRAFRRNLNVLPGKYRNRFGI